MRDVYIAGIGMTRFGRFGERRLDEFGTEAITAALTDGGLGPGDIEVAYAGHARSGRLHGRENGVGQLCCWACGIPEIPITSVGNFCASGSSSLRETWIAVGSGLYDVGLAIGVEQLSKRPEGGRPFTSDGMVMEGRMGFTPPAYFALAAQRYQQDFGLDERVLAKVAVKNRAHARLNPLAHYQDPITIKDVLDAPMVADPLTRLSCCATSDGGAAAVLVSQDAVKRLGLDRDRLVRILSSSLASGGYRNEALSSFDIDRRAGRLAYEAAGVGPEDIDLAEVHDAFTISEVIHYEDLGFCAPGEGMKLLADGEVALGGRIPVSTSGGLLSRGHALGATGIAQAHEVVIQLRGEAGERQVDGARIGLIHCVGGFVSNEPAASAVHILARS